MFEPAAQHTVFAPLAVEFVRSSNDKDLDMSTRQPKRSRQNRRKPMGTIEANAMRSAVTEREPSTGLQHPMSTALLVFGLGMGIGVMLGTLLSSHEPPPSFGKRAELAAEKLGRQMLDAVAGVLPSSISRHIS